MAGAPQSLLTQTVFPAKEQSLSWSASTLRITRLAAATGSQYFRQYWLQNKQIVSSPAPAGPKIQVVLQKLMKPLPDAQKTLTGAGRSGSSPVEASCSSCNAPHSTRGWKALCKHTAALAPASFHCKLARMAQSLGKAVYSCPAAGTVNTASCDTVKGNAPHA